MGLEGYSPLVLMPPPKRTQTDIRIRLLRVRLYCQARHSLFGGRCRDIDVATATDIHIHESIMEKRTDELTSPTRTVLAQSFRTAFGSPSSLLGSGGP